MIKKLKCFISAPYDTDLVLLKSILAEHDIETLDIYELSIGDSIQKIIKRQIRQSDFALFVLSKDNTNVIYEMGVCEGLGKQHFIILEKEYNLPIYLENKLLIRSDLKDKDLIKIHVEKILKSVDSKSIRKNESLKSTTAKKQTYSNSIKVNLSNYLAQIQELRITGHGRELENIIEEIFKTIRLNYVENSTNTDKGVDFALWSNELGKIIGNPIIVEVKYGNLSSSRVRGAEEQLKQYVSKSDARVALLLYLDKEGRRHKIDSTLSPLIIGYDVEDFISELLNHTFENLILSQRNKIAHGIE